MQRTHDWRTQGDSEDFFGVPDFLKLDMSYMNTKTLITMASIALLFGVAVVTTYIWQYLSVYGEMARHKEYLGRIVGIEIAVAFSEKRIASLAEFCDPKYPHPNDDKHFGYRLEINRNVTSLGPSHNPSPIAFLLPRKTIPGWYFYRPGATTIALTSDLATHRINPGHDFLGFYFTMEQSATAQPVHPEPTQ